MLTREAVDFAATRGISQQTLSEMRVIGGRATFDGETLPAIVFQYFDEDGQCVNYKARSVEGKRYKAKPGGKQIAYNWQAVIASANPDVYITEGEIDACSLVEAGLSADSVLSVPNGAPRDQNAPGSDKKPAEADSDIWAIGRYEWATNGLGGALNAKQRYILATDADGPGRALRLDLVRIFGAAKCWYVDWPEGIKDANEYLVKHGPEELRSFVSQEAKPWPVAGLFRMSEVPEAPEIELWDIGFAELAGRVKLAPTMLSVVTGWPGEGKTTLMQQCWLQIAREYDIRIAMMSAETRAKPHVRRNMRQFYWHRLERDMSFRQIREADDWIEEHILILDHEQPTVDWLVQSAEVAAIRHNCRALVIDPWNKIIEDFDGKADSETKWIGRTLDGFIAMSRALNIHTQIIAHPAKPDSASKHYAPDLYSISGSSHWFNRVDQGFCVYRERKFDGERRVTECQFKVLKTRFEELGYPAMFEMDYDPGRGVFFSTRFDNSLQKALRATGGVGDAVNKPERHLFGNEDAD